MKDFINTIFKEYGFTSENPTNDVWFYKKNISEQVEYYLVHFIDSDQLATFGQDSLTRVQEIFNQKKSELSDVNKNTSLIICVEFSSFASECIRFKNQMLRIEEDDYWFKKYLLPYTNNAVNALQTDESLVEKLNSIVSNDSFFAAFTADMYINESYFLALQCFLKLPFLNLRIDANQRFTSIAQLLSQRISEPEQKFLDEILLTISLENFQRDILLSKVLDPQSNTFDNFLNSFNTDAPNT